MREALDALEITKTALLVDGALKNGNRNLELSARNLEGVELVRGSEVHPYHLLRYEHAVFALPAIRKLQDSLKASAPERKVQPAARKSRKTEEVA
jgi:large subunit ribosomal protein L4